jgi:hypothetical protein
VRDHVWALAHNRGMMIRRHGRWYHAPVAAIRLTALGLSHARYYREPGALLACASGGVRGFRDGARVPACTALGRMEGS